MAEGSVHLELAEQHEKAMSRLEDRKAQLDSWLVVDGFHAVEQYVQAALERLSGQHPRGFAAMVNELARRDDVPFEWVSYLAAIHYHTQKLRARPLPSAMLNDLTEGLSRIRDWAHGVLFGGPTI